METEVRYPVITMGTMGDVLSCMRVASTLQARGQELAFILRGRRANPVEWSWLRFTGLETDNASLRTGMVSLL